MATISSVFPEELKNHYVKAGHADMQGRRPTMEDATALHVHYRLCNHTQLDELFVGVYDGHGGTEASLYTSQQLHEIFKSKLALYEEYLTRTQQIITDGDDENQHTALQELQQAYSSLTRRLNKFLKVAPLSCHNSEEDDEDDEDDDEELPDSGEDKSVTKHADESSVRALTIETMSEQDVIPLLLREAFLETNEKLCFDEKIKNGTTASVAYMRPITTTTTTTSTTVTHRLYTANVGDSRIVLCRNGQAVRLTVDHRPNDPDEQRRVRDAGGYIINHRVNAILAVTRAIGDVYLQPMVSSDPHTSVVNIRPEDEFIIIACDGVWDVIEDQAAVDLIKGESDPRVASCKLRDEAYSRGSTDNISVIVLRIKEQDASVVAVEN
jgi:serine/threonine protein phosphatase PrpC